jgi:hypothetical protein
MTTTPDLKAAALAATTLDIEKLKAAAEAATPGPWRSMYSGRGNAVYYHVSATAPAIPRFCAERSIEIASINPSAGADQANSFFIGLANPATILTLIERLHVAEDAAKDTDSKVPDGWTFHTCDFSLRTTGKHPNGSVMLMRDKAGRAAWHALSEDGKEATELYASGNGATFEAALAEAINNAISFGRLTP